MSLNKIFEISGSALLAQSQRLNVVASNLANADSAAKPGEPAYRARQAVFQTMPTENGAAGVTVASVTEDTAPARRLFDPKHPYADKDGYVTLSNVNVVEEMVNMISASRSYQSNAEVMNTAKSLIQKTLALGS